MNEQLNKTKTHDIPSPDNGVDLYPDDEVVRLLANPEVQQGLIEADAVVAEYYRNLEAEGRVVEPVLKGITATGDCIQAAQYDSSPDDFSAQGNNYTQRYVVFVYPLSEVQTPGFAEALEPRDVGHVSVYLGSGINIDVGKPDAPITTTQAHLQKAIGSGLTKNDPAFMDLSKAAFEQSKAADRLHLPQVSPDKAKFNGQPVMTFEDAAFGSRREAFIDQVVAPLALKHDEHATNYAINGHPEVKAQERTAQSALGRRMRETAAIMRANPTMIDQGGDELIFDKAKAEYVAHEIHKAKAKKAGVVAVQAAANYDSDPLGVFETKRKGFMGRFGSR